MERHRRTVHRPSGVPGLEQVGRDLHGEVIPLAEHRHQGTEICYLAGGEVVWVLGRRRLRLVGGMVSVMSPGLVHRGELDVIAPADLYWAVLHAQKLQPKLDARSLKALTGRRARVAEAPACVGRLFAEIMAECAAKKPGWRAAAGARLTVLATECARLTPRRGPRRSRPLPPAIARAARLIAGDLEHPPAARELARAAGLGPTRFHALFKHTMGLTPRDYLARLRLAEARRRLAAESGDITALAFSLGFPSSQHFATTFKKHTGLTPSEYRRRSAPGRKKK